jgi:hypothetical protein
VGIALAALLAGGGAIAGASLARTSPSTTPSADTGAAGSTGSGPGGSGTGTTASTAGSGSQAALLNATLNAAGSPNAAVATAPAGAAAAAPAVRRCAKAARAARAARLSGHPRLSRAARAATARCRFIRRRIHRFFLLRGVDGQFSFRTRSGAIRTLAYERGVIESVNSGSSIVVKAADGTIWSWDLVSNTVVRDLSGKISKSALAVGQPVWVGGRMVSGAKDARLIFVRPPSR